MIDYQLVSKTGRKYRVSLPDPRPGLRSAFLFAFAKSGSTLLNNMVTEYCAHIGVPTFSLFDAAFGQGIPTQHIMGDAAACLQREGYVYTGFRHFPKFELDLAGVPAVWLTRDPRDMLVSQYFSVRHSHAVPRGLDFFRRNREQAARLSIDEYVLEKAAPFALQFEHYRVNLAGTDLKVFRYEDVIYAKTQWLANVVTHLGLKEHPQLIAATAEQFDVYPEAENEARHIRRVHPGDHRNKLRPETIAAINTDLAEFLKTFEYDA